MTSFPNFSGTLGRIMEANTRQGKKEAFDEFAKRNAERTAFVSRFIVLREARKSKAHREIEKMIWQETETAKDIAKKFRKAFLENGDKIETVDRDIKRALDHASCSVNHFIEQYLDRTFLSFQDALLDYKRSNELLFDSEAPRSGGWKLE